MTVVSRFLSLGLLSVALLNGTLILGCGEPEPVATPEEPSPEDSAAEPAGEFDFAAMQGEWSIVGADGGEGDVVTITDETSYAWSVPGRPDATLVFDPDAESPPGVVWLTYESSEDTEEVGGGGPRKAIARPAANGDVEILAALSAAYDHPLGDAELRLELTLRKR